MIAAACFAGSHVSVRRGLVHTSVVTGVLISLSTALVVISCFVIATAPHELDRTGITMFALSGLAAPGISRWANTTGVHRLGPSIAIPITQGTRPLLAVAGAVLILGETLSAQRLLGLAIILAGGWELSRLRPEARPAALGEIELLELEKKPRNQRILRPGIVFPLLAGTAHASSDLVVKEALTHLKSPAVGAMVGLATALLIWGVGSISVPSVRKRLTLGPDFGWLIGSGILASLALMSLFTALEIGDVTLVSPITASQPLAVFLFSRLLLSRLEHITLSTVLAGTGIVVGTILVAL